MTATDASWLTVAMVGGTAIIATGYRLDGPIRAAGQRRTWGRGLIRTRLPDHPRTHTARTEEA
ncbi:hypothetical protein [Methylobacterium fujisawaense]